MVLQLVVPVILFLVLVVWTWALCETLRRQEPYAWLIGLIFLPPIVLPAYLYNRVSNGMLDRAYRGYLDRQRTKVLEAVVEKDPTFQLRLELARLLYGQKRYAEALRQLGEAMNVDDEHREVQFLAGMALLAMGRREAALPHLQFVTDADPGFRDGEAAVAAAEALHEMGRSEEALALLNQATRRLSIPWVVVSKAQLLMALGRNEEAKKVLTDLLAPSTAGHSAASDRRHRRALAAARGLMGKL
jgi:hypothetical protein